MDAVATKVVAVAGVAYVPWQPLACRLLLLQDRKAGSGRIGEAGGRGLVDINPPRGTRDFFPEVRRGGGGGGG